jgi:hypothetical protein
MIPHDTGKASLTTEGLTMAGCRLASVETEGQDMKQPPPEEDDQRTRWLVMLLAKYHCTHKHAAEICSVTENCIERWVAMPTADYWRAPDINACKVLKDALDAETEKP